jgi:hypothetical protein
VVTAQWLVIDPNAALGGLFNLFTPSFFPSLLPPSPPYGIFISGLKRMMFSLPSTVSSLHHSFLQSALMRTRWYLLVNAKKLWGHQYYRINCQRTVDPECPILHNRSFNSTYKGHGASFNIIKHRFITVKTYTHTKHTNIFCKIYYLHSRKHVWYQAVWSYHQEMWLVPSVKSF